MDRKEVAGPVGGTIGAGRVWNAVAPLSYSPDPLTATALAELYVRRRLHVSAPLARVVVDLAGLARCA